MPKGTLKKSKATAALVIEPVEKLHSPNFDHYMKVMDDVFRNGGCDEIFAAAGFVCYLGIDRSRTLRVGQDRSTSMNWFRRHNGSLPGLRDREHAEKMLARYYTGSIWRTYIRGQRHDYYFYATYNTIEECLDLIEVARVMTS